MSATAQNDRVNNVTLEDILTTTVDTVSRSSEIEKWARYNPKRWTGRFKQWNLFTDQATSGTSFKNTEEFDTGIDYSTVPAVLYPTGYAQPVGVSIVERSLNATPSGKIDMYRNAYEYAQNSMISALGTMDYGFGLGNDQDGLGNIIDDGTSTSSIYGLSRTTYGSKINAGGSTGIIAANGGVIDLDTLDAADDAASVSGDNSESPNVVLTDKTTWSLMASLGNPTLTATYNALGGKFATGKDGRGGAVNMAGGINVQAGATNFEYRNKVVIRDEKCTVGNAYLVNKKYYGYDSLKLIGLDTIGITQETVEGANDNMVSVGTAFQYRKPMMAFNNLSELGIFVVYGNMYHRNPNRNELITGITTT